MPLHRHHATLVLIDHDELTLKSHEYGGVVQRWDHTLRVERVTDDRSRYHDIVEIEAGRLTPLVAWFAQFLYRYRHRRWRKLVSKHLADPPLV